LIEFIPVLIILTNGLKR